MTGDWPCEAYGERGLAVGARCFLAEMGERHCPDAETCAEIMRTERRRVHRRLQHLAESGDEMAQLLAADFPTPESLLGGADDPDEAE